MNNKLALSLLSSLFISGCAATTEVGPPAPAPAPPASAGHTATPESGTPLFDLPVDGLPSIGNPNAPVTAVSFVDYGCPVCGKSNAALDAVRTRRPDDLRIVIVLKPLPLNKLSRPAALAALAAARQGKFEAMHGALAALDGKLDEASLARAARTAGLDLARFEADRSGAEVERALAASEALATRFSVTRIPTVVLNGRYVPKQSAEDYASAVDAEAPTARALLTNGVPADRLYATIVAGGRKEGPIGRLFVEPTHANLLASHRGEIAGCWREVSASYPADQRTEVTVAVVVRADGTLGKVEITPASPLATCIEKLSAGWTFRPTSADQTVKMSFGFTRRS